MNRKGILIGVLAALMLFAFTACEPTTSLLAGVAGLTYTGGGETVYLPGETLDLSEYDFYLVMQDKSTKPVDVSKLTYAKDELVVKDGKTYTLTYGGEIGVEIKNVKVGEVTEITVDATSKDVQKRYYAPTTAGAAEGDKYKDDLIDLTGVVITAKYTDDEGVTGERTIAVDNPEVSAVMTNATPANVWTAAAGNKIKVSYDGVDGQEYDVTVVENKIQSVALKLADENYAVYRDGKKAGSDALSYSLTDGIYIEETFVNGEVKKLDSSSDSAEIALFKFKGSSNFDIASVDKISYSADDDMISVTAQYTGKKGAADIDIVTNTIEVPVKAEALTGVEVGGVTSSSTVVMKDYANETTIGNIVTGFTLTAKYASGETVSITDKYNKQDTDANNYYTIAFDGVEGLDLTEKYEDHTRHTVTVDAVVDGEKASTTFSVVIVEPTN